MATLYHTNGLEEKVDPKNGKTFGLKELQVMVGGFIEIVQLLDTNEILVINEEGKQSGLPPNIKATLRAEEVLGYFDIIVGPALLCSYNEEGDMLP